MPITTRFGKSGTIMIPAELRDRLGLSEGSEVIVEASEAGILVRPREADIEIYTPERKAEFLLNNAVDEEDYQWAVAEVRKMGLNPDAIPHDRP